MHFYIRLVFLATFSFLLYQYYNKEDNFSEETIEEFLMLDRSLAKSNELTTFYIDDIIMEMEATAKTKVQYDPLIVKAREVGVLTKGFIDYIKSLKTRLITESGGTYQKQLIDDINSPINIPLGLKDKKTPHNLFITGGASKEPQSIVLKFKIAELHKNCISLIEDLWTKHPIKGTIFCDLNRKASTIENLKSNMTNEFAIEDFNLSTPSIFSNKSVAAILPLLQKLINDAQNLELFLVDFLQSNQFSGCNFGYDSFDVLSLSPKPHIRLGETYTTEIALGSYASKANFSVQVNSQKVESVNGRAIYKTKPTSIGKKEYTAKIIVTNPLTDETETYFKSFQYEVIP